jgi:hypothetical protein
MMRIHIDRTFKVFNGGQGIAAVCPDAAHLKRIFSTAGSGGRNASQQPLSFVDTTGGADGPGATQRAANGIDSGLGSQIKLRRGFLWAIERRQALPVNVHRHAVFGDIRQKSICLPLTRQKIAANAGTSHNVFSSLACFNSARKVAYVLTHLGQL